MLVLRNIPHFVQFCVWTFLGIISQIFFFLIKSLWSRSSICSGCLHSSLWKMFYPQSAWLVGLLFLLFKNSVLCSISHQLGLPQPLHQLLLMFFSPLTSLPSYLPLSLLLLVLLLVHQNKYHTYLAYLSFLPKLSYF